MSDDGVWRLPPRIVEAHVAESELGERVPWHVSTPRIDQLHKLATGAGIRIGIVDTGVSSAHKRSGNDLANVADANDFTGSQVGFEDVHGHGTHVAGISGARRNDGGIVGVAPNATLYCQKGLGDSGTGRGQWIAAAIAKCQQSNVHIINLSLGSPGRDDAILRAIHEARDAGIFVVVAAGNGGEFATSWPASDDSTISVAAVDRTGVIADFSEPSSVDVCGYGVAILSCYKGSGYASLSGTSMAAPWFAGVLALRLEFEAVHSLPRTTPDNLIERLTFWCDEVKATAKNPRTGVGLPNVERMLKLPTVEPVPQPPPIDRPPGVPPIGHTWQRRWVAEPLPVPSAT